MSSIHSVNVGGSTYSISDSSNMAPLEATMFASRPYSKGRFMILPDGLMYKAKTDISSSDALVINSNIERANFDDVIADLEKISDTIAPTENGETASTDYAVGAQIIRNGALYDVISAIDEDDYLVVGNNIELAPTISSQIQTLTNKVDGLTEHYWLLVSDSYGDPSAVGSADTWLERFESITGDNCLKVYKGGYGFAPVYNAPFIDLITPGVVDTGVPASFDTSLITDIVVLGGFNDRAVSVDTIKTAISDFCSYAKSTYENLKNIYIGACGWSMNAEHLALLSKGRYIKAYSECGDYGAVYLSGVEHVMHGFELYTAEVNSSLALDYQYVHPNAAGSQRLAQAAYNAIKNGYATCHMPWATHTFTLKNGITVNGDDEITTAQYQQDNMICLNMPSITYTGSFSIGNSKTVIPLATIDHGYYNANDFTMIPCTGFVAGNGYSVNTPMDMYYQITGGELQIVLSGNLESNNTKTATYIVTNPVNVFINDLAS